MKKMEQNAIEIVNTVQLVNVFIHQQHPAKQQAL